MNDKNIFFEYWFYDSLENKQKNIFLEYRFNTENGASWWTQLKGSWNYPHAKPKLSFFSLSLIYYIDLCILAPLLRMFVVMNNKCFFHILKCWLSVKSSYLNRVLSKLIAEVGRRQVGFFVADGGESGSLANLSQWILRQILFNIQTNTYQTLDK